MYTIMEIKSKPIYISIHFVWKPLRDKWFSEDNINLHITHVDVKIK